MMKTLGLTRHARPRADRHRGDDEVALRGDQPGDGEAVLAQRRSARPRASAARTTPTAAGSPSSASCPITATASSTTPSRSSRAPTCRLPTARSRTPASRSARPAIRRSISAPAREAIRASDPQDGRVPGRDDGGTAASAATGSTSCSAGCSRCSAASRWCSPRSASTACCRTRSSSARRRSACAWRSAPAARDVLRLVVVQGIRLAIIGVVDRRRRIVFRDAGHPSASWSTSARRIPLSFIGVSIFLTAVAFVASYVPARRAMAVDPLVALRAE